MVTSYFPKMANSSYGNHNMFVQLPVIRTNPQNNFLPYSNQENIMMNPQLEYNMMNYMKGLNHWHNTQMWVGQRQMVHNQMAYQMFMASIGCPFLRMF